MCKGDIETTQFEYDLTPKQKGIISEYRCITWFLERGYDVSIPIGDNAPYDMIVDISGKLIKIQVKSAYIGRPGTFTIELTKNVSSRTKIACTKYRDSEVDYFATCFKENVYIIPYEDAVQMTLRYELPAKNVGGGSIKWAPAYLGDYVIRCMFDKDAEPPVELNKLLDSYEKLR